MNILKRDLLEVVKRVNTVTLKKSSLHILKSIKIEFYPNMMFVSSTDLDICLRESILIDTGIEKKIICVDGKKLQTALEKIKTIYISIEIDDNVCITLKADSGLKMDISTVSPFDFPEFPEKETITNISNIDSKILNSMINKTAFAVSQDEARETLTHILFRTKKNKLTMVACDGHRLGLCKTDIQFNYDDKIDSLVSVKTLKVLQKYCKKEETIYIKFCDKYIIFEGESFKLFGKLLKENYPKYENVMPEHFEHNINLNTKNLMESLKEVLPFTNGKNNLIKIVFEENKYTLISTDLDEGTEVKKEIDCINKETFKRGFNCKFLIEILSKIDTKEFKFNISSGIGPCCPVPTDIKETDDFFLIMPLRILEEV
jgi:DNA polymerase-3 subunit beta